MTGTPEPQKMGSLEQLQTKIAAAKQLIVNIATTIDSKYETLYGPRPQNPIDDAEVADPGNGQVGITIVELDDLVGSLRVLRADVDGLLDRL